MSFERFFFRNYYLLVALSSQGGLIFEEDREGSVYEVRLRPGRFANGNRHSIYYVRDNNTTTLLVCYSCYCFKAFPALQVD